MEQAHKRFTAEQIAALLKEYCREATGTHNQAHGLLMTQAPGERTFQ